MTAAERAFVTAQLRRAPRTPWRIAVRCPHERPAVIATPPRLADGSPFPTLFWLTCPGLVARIGGLESAGAIDEWTRRLAEDAELAARVLDADAAYREARHAEGSGEDPCAEVGVAGLRDPLLTKCLHAHAAAFLGGIADPIGEDAFERVGGWCSADECAAFEARAAAEAALEARAAAEAALEGASAEAQR